MERLTAFDPLSGWQDCIEDVLLLRFIVDVGHWDPPLRRCVSTQVRAGVTTEKSFKSVSAVLRVYSYFQRNSSSSESRQLLRQSIESRDLLAR